MKPQSLLPLAVLAAITQAGAAGGPAAFAADPAQSLERTCFQTGAPWGEKYNLRSDVAIVYGIDPQLPERIKTWRDHGYRIHVMTGVSWGNYQDYLYGRFDGINHEDEAQTVSDGRKSSHGGDVYYMCPGVNFGKFLSVGVQRALDAGAEAIHLEEPEFWVNAGYSDGFKREWQAYYGEPWQAPQSSVNAQWRASKLKYFLYRRALQQVFDHVQAYNQRSGRKVRCYVPTHSLLNYAHWNIVSPESSLARLKGCDGYIAQVWTGTARTPNVYQGKLKERTFETAFLEYGAMQNLVRATGRSVWYLNDPIEDNPNHDWNDYQRNWESTLTASLLQPDVWQFEVAPWPERIFNGRYPKSGKRENRIPIPPGYATELQTVMNALNDLKQDRVEWDCGTTGIGLLVSDSLMFQRGDPTPSDSHLSHVYGLALPLLKHGIPVAPVQLENVTVPHYLDAFKILMLTYQGMKPLNAEVHAHLAEWVKQGGQLIFCDDDSDPFNAVKDWWNSDGNKFTTPREPLFAQLGFPHATPNNPEQPVWPHGHGQVRWLRQNPVQLAASAEGAAVVVGAVKHAAASAKLDWRETNSLVLRRGPYVIAAGLDESIPGEPKTLHGRFVNLFDPELRVLHDVRIDPGSRYFLRDLDAAPVANPQLLAAACKPLPVKSTKTTLSYLVEGAAQTQAVMLLRLPSSPRKVTLDDQPLTQIDFTKQDGLLWLRFPNEARPRTLTLEF
ncbi:MAG: hypothetical protein K9N23_00265 [Akkermansiaceae bacterium]|nr:hypothetical protein [Akkermansiaceae bacterium]MCF7730083.1 hypothetical protein [Akkermansiaceae bacterium]